MSRNTFAALEAEYENLWETMELRKDKIPALRAVAIRIVGAKSRYRYIEKQTNIPWFVVGVIHAMECGLSFTRHLHNGDDLRFRTTSVPAGRPRHPGHGPGGAYTWEESALDALSIDGTDKVAEWTPSRLAYELEKFNGFGSRNKGIHSPYLWSYSDHYSRGKYIRDHVWDANAVSAQAGGMPLLKVLMDDHGCEFPAPIQPKPIAKSKIAITSAAVTTAGASVSASDVMDSLEKINQGKDQLDRLGVWNAVTHSFSTNKMVYVGIAIVVLAGFIIYWRWKDHGRGS